MSLALLTTLYGAILAFLFFNPIAAKLAHRTAEEIAEQRVAIAGVEAILKGDSALAIRSRLEALQGGDLGARPVAA
jgi:chemotaxis protein MotA